MNDEIKEILDKMKKCENKRMNEYPIEEELEEAYKTINQLTNNWNELENYVGGYIYLLKTNPDIIEGQIDTLYEVLDKMKEIKEGKDV